MTRIVRLVIVALVVCAGVGHAGVAFFDDLTDSIEVSGQTVFGTASTYEAIVLYPSAHNGSGASIFNEWTDFAEDKYFAVIPGTMGGLYGYNHPVNPGNVMTGAVSVAFDQWHHVAFVYDGSEERLYLDGTLVTSRAATGVVTDGAGLGYIGAIFRDNAARNSFIGLIDVLRLSDVARYTGSSFTPPSPAMTSDSNTVLLYTFDDAPGSPTVADASSGRTGTLGGGFWGPTSPILCGNDPTDADGDFIPDSCDPDPPATTSSTTTTTTSTVVGASTTSTTLAGSCEGAFATFASIRCRIVALLGETQAASGLGNFQSKSVHSLESARDRLDDAGTICGGGNVKKARKRVQQSGKAVSQYRHRLGSRPARAKIDPTLRKHLQNSAGSIHDDLVKLHKSVACPGDAP